MFDIKPTQEQKDYAAEQIEKYNFGQRGRGDGNKEQQYVGVLGQTIVADLLEMTRPDGEDGNDGGVDFTINGKKVDVKTMSRTVSMKEHYVHNFIAYQKDYLNDAYIFLSYNKNNDTLSICGTVSKEQFNERASFYEKGEMRYRDDGTFFPTKAPLYEIKQSDLNPVNSIEDIEKM
jgi:hypothetical protein